MKKLKNPTKVMLVATILFANMSLPAHASELAEKQEKVSKVLSVLGTSSEFSNELVKRFYKVEIPDKALKEGIYKYLGKDLKENITISDLEKITELQLDDMQIESLEGLQYCKNLISLSLKGNKISDLAPLKKLSDLTFLDLGSNQIKDLTPLKGLSELVVLHLYDNDLDFESKEVKEYIDLLKEQGCSLILEEGDLFELL